MRQYQELLNRVPTEGLRNDGRIAAGTSAGFGHQMRFVASAWHPADILRMGLAPCRRLFEVVVGQGSRNFRSPE